MPLFTKNDATVNWLWQALCRREVLPNGERLVAFAADRGLTIDSLTARKLAFDFRGWHRVHRPLERPHQQLPL